MTERTHVNIPPPIEEVGRGGNEGLPRQPGQIEKSEDDKLGWIV